MKFLKYFFLFFLITSCSDDSDCIKRITVPDNMVKTSSGFTFIPSYTVDVPCEFDEENEIKVAEVLKNFSYEVVSFNFTPDTGNNTSKLEFEVILKNGNNFSVEGTPIFSMRTDNVEFSTNYQGSNGNCTTIDANGNCVFKYSKEASLDLGIVKSIELTSIKYLLKE